MASEREGVAGWLSRSLCFLIRFYQLYISPHKGFCCAHRVAHGGPSCSEYARLTLKRDGAWRSWPSIRQRLRGCREAALELAQSRSVSPSGGSGKAEAPDPESPESETGRKRKKKSNSSCVPDRCWPADCGLVGCDAVTLGGCEAGGCETIGCLSL